MTPEARRVEIWRGYTFFTPAAKCGSDILKIIGIFASTGGLCQPLGVGVGLEIA